MNFYGGDILPKGLPKSIIKKYGITKKAWRVYRGRKGKKRTRSTRRSSNPKRRRKRNLPKTKRRTGGKNLQATVFKWLRIGSLVGPAVGEAIRWKDQPEEIFPQVLKLYSGYYYPRGEFSFTWLKQGWMPFIATTLMTALVPKISGIIRRI